MEHTNFTIEEVKFLSDIIKLSTTPRFLYRNSWKPLW